MWPGGSPALRRRNPGPSGRGGRGPAGRRGDGTAPLAERPAGAQPTGGGVPGPAVGEVAGAGRPGTALRRRGAASGGWGQPARVGAVPIGYQALMANSTETPIPLTGLRLDR